MANEVDRNPSEATIDAVRDAAVQAYYTDRVRVGAGARTRAQAAQSIVTLFAGTLVASFTLSALAKHEAVTRVSGCVAVLLWLVAAILFIRAIATPVEPPPSLSDAEADPQKLVGALIVRADHEREQIDKWRAGANWISILALAATFLTFVLAVFLGEVTKGDSGSVALNAKGTQAVQTLCGFTMDRLDGDVLTETVTTPFIAIKVKTCRTAKDVIVRIPRDGVESLSTKKE